MAELEAGKANPNPEPAKPAVKAAADATKYVGTPAVGTSKAAAAGGVAGTAPSTEIDRRRRRFVWTMVTGFAIRVKWARAAGCSLPCITPYGRWRLNA